MDLPILNLSILSNLTVFVLEQTAEKLSICMRTFAKYKDKDKDKDKDLVQIVTNEQSLPLYETFQNVQTIYDSKKYEYTRGATFLFDNCFTDEEWKKDTKLIDFISYPRMYGLTTVFGFQHLPAISSRMCWNLDMICIGTTADKETIYERFFLYLLSYDTFCELLEQSTKENGFLVLRREGTEDTIYKANC